MESDVLWCDWDLTTRLCILVIAEVAEWTRVTIRTYTYIIYSIFIYIRILMVIRIMNIFKIISSRSSFVCPLQGFCGHRHLGKFFVGSLFHEVLRSVELSYHFRSAYVSPPAPGVVCERPSRTSRIRIPESPVIGICSSRSLKNRSG